MNDVYGARSQEFGEQYEGQEGSEIVGLVIATGEWLERLILNPAAVKVAMRALFAELEGADALEYYRDAGWREAWSEGFEESNLRASQLFVELSAYAFWGLRPDSHFFGVKPEAGEDYIELIARLVGLGRSLLDFTPPGWGAPRDLANTILAAEARLCTDTDEDLTPPQLAALARLSLKSIKNLLAPGNSEGVKLKSDGKINSAEAKRWLEARPDFRASIWHLYETQDCVPPREEPRLDDVLFVPASKDGSIFDPVHCRGASGYTIGKKGAEQKIADYLSALDQLTQMPTPYWRRPNAGGNWGLVAGVSWERKTRFELGLMNVPKGGNL